MKGQLSAEMLILIAVILAIVAIAAIQMLGTARETSGNIGNQTAHLNELASVAVKSPEGGYCFDINDCQSDMGACENNRCVK